MSARDLEDTHRWMRRGTAAFGAAVQRCAGDLDEPSLLPGWSRKHVVAHVAANADAVANLVHWAATGVPTPMYASPEARLAGVESGSRLPGTELIGWLHRSIEALDAAVAGLTDAQWRTPVVTAQGRTVPASEVPWMRSREVFVHAVDLAAGTSFADLPSDFLAALCDDVVSKRGAAPGPAVRLEPADSAERWDLPGDGEPVTVIGPLAELTAYLTGREHHLGAAGGGPAPALAAWL